MRPRLAAQLKKLQKTAKAKGLAHRFAEIEALTRPGMDLSLKKAKPADLKSGAVSRIGGQPDLAPNHAWPTHGGAPLTFVAQIVITPTIKEHDLEDLLPKEGILSFFAQLDPNAFDYGDYGVVLFTPAATGLVRVARPVPDCVLKSAGSLRSSCPGGSSRQSPWAPERRGRA